MSSFFKRIGRRWEDLNKSRELALFAETATKMFSPVSLWLSRAEFLKRNPSIAVLLKTALESDVGHLKEQAAQFSSDPFARSQRLSYFVLGKFVKKDDADAFELMEDVGDPSWKAALWAMIAKAILPMDKRREGVEKGIVASQAVQSMILRDNVLFSLYAVAVSIKDKALKERILQMIQNSKTKKMFQKMDAQ